MEKLHYKFISIAFALLYFLTGCVAQAEDNSFLAGAPNEVTKKQQSPAQAQAPAIKGKGIELNDILEDIRNFTRISKLKITDPDTGNVYTVSARVIAGFEQSPPNSLVLDDGTKIFWSWQEGQPERKSIAIFDGDNVLKMVGAADNMPLLYSRESGVAITNMDDYRKLIEERSIYMAEPIVRIYVENQRTADIFYPLAARWIQAAMMGFNANCSDEVQSLSCRFALEANIATTIYRIDCKDTDAPGACRLRLPSVEKYETKIDYFTQ